MGEILISAAEEGKFDLRHRDDQDRGDLITYVETEEAERIARFDDGEKYRPLKTAPNLRHGWRLILADVSAVRLALDGFYPGRIAALLAYENDALLTSSLRETLARQTGIYRVAARITKGDANDLVARFCRSDGGCLRTIRWPQDQAGGVASSLLPMAKFDPGYDQTARGESTVPLLCQEACNLLVAAARGVVKSTAG